MGDNIQFARKPTKGEPWDVAIVGSGPAGLTAAIYTVRGAASTLILAGDNWGGQLMLTTQVDNFPGFPDGVQGPDLMNQMRQQAERFGAEFIQKNAEHIDFDSDPKVITAGGEKYRVKVVIIATGADIKWLKVPGEETFRGRGVASCAPCDAPFFKNKQVVVVGGGDSAMEEALVLTKYADKVTIIHRRDEFKASAAMQERVFAEVKKGKINIIWNSEILEFLGDIKLEKIRIKNNKTGVESEMTIDGVFVAIGHIPATEMFKDKLEVDERGFIIRMPTEHDKEVEEKMHFHTKTSLKGVFVSGDVHDHVYRQAITAAGFGCMAGLDALRYLDKNIPNW